MSLQKVGTHIQHIVVYSCHCCHGNTTIHFLLIVSGTDAVINNMSCSVLPRKFNSGFPLHCCQATKYFVLLLSKISIKYYECASAFLP